MKKFFSILVVALVSTAMSFGQNTLVATLTHGDEISMFYGIGAFKSAHDAAVSGDIVTLSGGKFEGVTITKAITLRGTGVDAETPTKVDGLEIRVKTDDENKVMIEGIISSVTFYSSSATPVFNKCNISKINCANNASIDNAYFLNCIIDVIYFPAPNTATFSHCYLMITNFGMVQNCLFLNCFIEGLLSSYMENCTYVNSILKMSVLSNKLKGSNTAMNCLVLNASDPFANMQGTAIDCYIYWSGSFNYETIYTSNWELTDEAKAKYLGTDGTEIGLYGGQYPYNPTPSYPRITQLNVAKQATADNKLSVDITVCATDE